MIPTDQNPLSIEPPFKRRLEYIESDGNQYIDTGLTRNDIVNYNIIWTHESAYYKNGAEGVNGSGGYYFCGVSKSKYYVGNGSTGSSAKTIDDNFHIFEINRSEHNFKIDGTIYVSNTRRFF